MNKVDEGLHCKFATSLYNNHVNNKLAAERIKEIICDAVEIEKNFVTDSIPVSLIGMNSDLMKQYIEFVADFWLLELGCSKVYNVANPFDFMEMISLNSVGNFFEKKISAYSKPRDRKVDFNEYTDDF